MLKAIVKAIMINVLTHVHNTDIVSMVFANVPQGGLALTVVLNLDVLTTVQIKERVMLMDLVLVKQDIVEMIVQLDLLKK